MAATSVSDAVTPLAPPLTKLAVAKLYEQNLAECGTFNLLLEKHR